jgi:sugar lactone lactonase YvrE
VASLAHAQSPTVVYNFERVAGHTDRTDGLVDGLGADARFSNPTALVMAPDGTLYILDKGNQRLRRLSGGVVSTLGGSWPSGSLATGPDNALYLGLDRSLFRSTNGSTPTVLTGSGAEGFANGPLADARFAEISGVATDGAGNVYVTEGFPGFIGYCFPEQAGNMVRKITPAGEVSTLAGAPCSVGSTDGPGQDARFYWPTAIAATASGVVYVVDSLNYTIRRIGTDGVVSTLAGGVGQSGLADGTGSAARLQQPRELVLDPAGAGLYFLDGNSTTYLRFINFAGQVTTIGQVPMVSGMIAPETGTFLVTYSNTIASMSSQGTLTTVAGLAWSPANAPGAVDGPAASARFRDLRGIVSDGTGGFYLSDAFNQTIRHLSSSGVVSTVAGQAGVTGATDGPAAQARFSLPQGLARAADGTLYIADEGNSRVRRMTPDGVVSTLPGTFSRPIGVAVDAANNVYVCDLAGAVQRITSAGAVSMFTNRTCSAMVAEPAGTIVIRDTAFATLRHQPDGSTNGVLLDIIPMAVDQAGRIYELARRAWDQPVMVREMDTDGTIRAVPLYVNGQVVNPLSESSLGYTKMAVSPSGELYVTKGLVWRGTPSLASITAQPAALTFAGIRQGASTTLSAPQQLRFLYEGFNTVSWTVSSSASWLTVSHTSGTGPRVLTVTVSDPGAAGSYVGSLMVTATRGGRTDTFSVPVTLTVHAGDGAGGAPFGTIDTPTDGATGLSGSLAVTGWALDDVAVSHVRVWRNCVEAIDRSRGVCMSPHPGAPEAVYIGEATLLPGARPDVEAAYPLLPNAQRAGWGLLVLTNLLPDLTRNLPVGGQGTLQITAYATDLEGRVTSLGTRSVTLNNDGAVLPFGAIDTPGQGETISGTFVPMFGWVLTPDNGSGVLMPTDGSTIRAFIDGALVGSVTYDQCRGSVGTPPPTGVLCDDDVSGAFRGDGTRYRNLDAGRGAIGVRVLDTTTLSDGQHMLVWTVTDSLGRTENIGSRYFFVSNGATTRPSADTTMARARSSSSAEIAVRLGFDLDAPFVALEADQTGVRRIDVPALGRLELVVPGVDNVTMLVDAETRPAPVGLSIDRAAGRVTWTPGPGFVGVYQFVVALAGGQAQMVVVNVR